VILKAVEYPAQGIPVEQGQPAMVATWHQPPHRWVQIEFNSRFSAPTLRQRWVIPRRTWKRSLHWPERFWLAVTT